MNIKKIEIYLNSQWQDISSNIDTNKKISIVTRCDEAFPTGNLIAWLERDKNIPPYTPLKITYFNNSTEMYCCSSTYKRYLANPQLYIHEIELLDKSAWMSCWILGSKNFSCQTEWPEDWKKMYKIYALMTQKYGITYSRVGWDTKFTQNQEFTFEPGRTMYDAYCEIMGTYNCKPVITEWKPEKNEFTIGYKDLTVSTEYAINLNNVLYEEMRQGVDTYCKYLESEVANVIDHDLTLVVSNLSCRSDSVQMSADELRLYLPTKIESIDKFKVIYDNSLHFSFYKIDKYKYFSQFIDPNNGDALIGISVGDVKSLYDWFGYTKPDNGNNIEDSILYKLFMLINEEFPEDVPYNVVYDWRFQLNINDDTDYIDFIWVGMDGQYGDYAPFKVNATDLILEETQYNCLEPKDMPKYCYFKSGDYVIDGLNLRYKDDLWNKILGNTEYNFLHQINTNKYTIDVNYTHPSDTTSYVHFMLSVAKETNPLNVMFEVEYYPIVDMLVKDSKDIIPLNESNYKPIARSYNNGANFIELNRLDYSLNKTNDFTGLEELTLEYSLANGVTAPVPGQFINYKGAKWYIASCNRIMSIDDDEVVINLVRDYNKIADAIGVKTQFESTKLPLNNVIDRHILVSTDEQLIFSNNTYLMLNVNGKRLFKNATLLTAGKGVYAVVEMLDQYAFERVATRVENTDYAVVNYVPYGNTKNEISKCNFSLVEINRNLSLEESYKLPNYDGYYLEKVKFENVTIYKDARERLIFTIWMPNAIVQSGIVESVLRIQVDSSIESYTVERTESFVLDAQLGPLSDGAPIYTGDILIVSATPKTNYFIDPYKTLYKVSNSNINIKLTGGQKKETIAPVITGTMTDNNINDILSFNIQNNNAEDMTLTVELYSVGASVPFEIYHVTISANSIWKDARELQMASCIIKASFYNPKYISSSSQLTIERPKK